MEKIIAKMEKVRMEKILAKMEKIIVLIRAVVGQGIQLLYNIIAENPSEQARESNPRLPHVGFEPTIFGLLSLTRYHLGHLCNAHV